MIVGDGRTSLVTGTRSYLDHNATTPLHPAARDAMTRAFDAYGNPSSVHAEGRKARIILDDARCQVATLTGTRPENVVFTSGGTEALNIALTPETAGDAGLCDMLLVGAGEHPAVLAGHRFGANVEIIPLSPDGTLDLAALEAALARRAGRRVMLALQAANNETGVIQPVAVAAKMVRAQGGLVVCDAVQAAGKIDCDIKSLGADAVTISAHKFGGPKGVGALCFAPGRSHIWTKGIVRGGGQERGLRSGTENLVGIAGLGAACGPADVRRRDETARLEGWCTTIERHIRAVRADTSIFGDRAPRLPNTVSFATPLLDAQVLTMSLDLNGVAVSAGSACASGTVKPSHVLTAMGVPADLATSAVRVSLGWTTRDEDIEAFADAFAKAVTTMRPRAAA